MSDEFQNKDNENNQNFNEENENLGNSVNEGNKDNRGSEDSSYEFWAESATRDNSENTNSELKDNFEGDNRDSYSLKRDQIIRDDENQNTNSRTTDDSNQSQYMQDDYNYYNQAGNDKTDSDLNSNKKNNILVKKAVKLIGTAAIFGVIAGATFVGFNALYDNAHPENNTTKIATTIDSTNGSNLSTTSVSSGTTGQDNDVSDVVTNTMPSIVSIKSTITQTYQDWFGQSYDQNAEGSGSGIIVGKNDTELLVATNNHVVAGANKIKVTFIDEKEYAAELKGTDETADLAVIAIKLKDINKETLSKIKIAVLGNSDAVKVGQMAIAIGNALGYGQSVTVGYISAKDRTVEISEEQSMVLLQTDAAINPGNSGGALLNVKGEVIGINSVKYASNEVEGMGYAIPISKATPIINDLMNREVLKESEQGYLGIAGNDVTTEVSKNYNMPVGVYVNEVLKDAAAEKAGIKVGDIITEVNDIAVQSIAALKEKVNSYRVGTKIKVTLMRSNNGEYKEQEVEVTLGKAPKTTSSSQKNNTTEQNTDENNSNNNQTNPNINGNDGNSGNSQDNGNSAFDYFDEFFNN